MKKYRVNVNGTVYEVELEDITGAAPASAPAAPAAPAAAPVSAPAGGEKITSLVSVPAFTEDEYLTMITKKGVIKRTLLTEYEYHRKGGKIALNLDE